MRERQKYYQRNSNKRYHRRGPLGVGLILVISALIIVAGARMYANDKSDLADSYGSQLSLSINKNDSKNENESDNKMVSQSDVPSGTSIDEYKGIPVYSNGTNYMSSHGLSYSEDGYYFGYKWQCVEHVKRFYYEIYGHEMPDGAGNAKYFYNPMLAQGELNEQRGLIQYNNGGDEKPQLDDLIVFTDGAYGHVAIISEVGQGWIEVIQQNSEYPRERYELKTENGKYIIEGDREPAGWLRTAD